MSEGFSCAVMGKSGMQLSPEKGREIKRRMLFKKTDNIACVILMGKIFWKEEN